MGQCITVDAAGVVTLLADIPQECPGYVLLSGPEYVAITTAQGIWGTPEPAAAVTYFSAPFVLIIVLYCAARGVGAVVKMFG